MGISMMFTISLLSTRFFGPILKKFHLQKLLRTSFSTTYINLEIFWDDLDSGQSLIWEIRILFQRMFSVCFWAIKNGIYREVQMLCSSWKTFVKVFFMTYSNLRIFEVHLLYFQVWFREQCKAFRFYQISKIYQFLYENVGIPT